MESSTLLVEESLIPDDTEITEGKSRGCCGSCRSTVVGMPKFHAGECKGKLGKSHFYGVTFLLSPALCASSVCEEQYCLKLVWFQLRSVYYAPYMWMTVNSPLKCKIHRWSPTILVQNFGPPPTDLWVVCTLREPSFHFKLPLSAWAVAWPNR